MKCDYILRPILTSVGFFLLIKLPAFILASALMEAAGLSRRLIKLEDY